jgi:hypothetical protein
VNCTWVIEAHRKPTKLKGKVGDVVPEKVCGGKAVVVFTKGKARPGKPREEYPRCKRHAPPAAYQEAIKQGFDHEELP